MKESENRYYIREFLNMPGYHSTGHILAYVEKTTIERKYCGSVNFTLAGCSRQIDLAFDLDDDESRANSLYKIDLLIKALQQFRKAFKAECVLQEELEAVAAKLKAEKDRLAAEKAATANQPRRQRRPQQGCGTVPKNLKKSDAIS